MSTVALHVLQPLGDGKTYRALDNKLVQIYNEQIHTWRGFTEQRIIKILFEETFYAENDTAVRLLVIERPLAGGKVPPPAAPKLQTYDECAKFLRSLPHGDLCLSQLSERLTDFSRLYRAEPDFEPHARNVLAAISSETTHGLLQVPAVAVRARELPWMHRVVKTAVDSMVMAGAYDTIFGALCSHCKFSDAAALRFATHNRANAAQLGLRPRLRCDLIEATKILRSIEQARTPADILGCVSGAISTAIQTAGSSAAVFRGQDNDDGAVGGDDLVPLTLWLLCKARLRYAASLARYLQCFVADAAIEDAGQAAYHMTTFCASVQFAVDNAPPIPESPKETPTSEPAFALPSTGSGTGLGKGLLRSLSPPPESAENVDEQAVLAALLAAGVTLDTRTRNSLRRPGDSDVGGATGMGQRGSQTFSPGQVSASLKAQTTQRPPSLGFGLGRR
eukprot:TRINITY_DN9203_c0_g1_i1.p1 TRINITY_DN9203_c0_g1~~TRINITY_DN9203_c0_g1_i1.p1  ORF type:complete len:512 (-),score=65.96 TRINITY_DN9203_c0_g1_i1:847-2193(-)